MDLTEVEIFRAVAQEQSVTRAAAVLDRAQSNVTTRVKQLEESLGVSLFRRDSKRMILTPEGLRFLGYANRLLALAEEARQSMQQVVPTGRLRVGSMEAAAASRLTHPLARFHKQWPDVEIELQTGTTQFLTDAVAAHRVDCAIVAHAPADTDSDGDTDSAPSFASGLAGTYLFTEDLVLVVPASHKRVRRPSDLTIRTLAAFSRGCTYRQCALDWLASEGDRPQHDIKVLEMSSYHAMLASVSAGAAVAIVPKSLLDQHRYALDVQTVSLRKVPSYLIRREGYDTVAYTAFLEELQRV
ncbi:LysR family transcriptional regulator [Cupriavidus plantarum]|uniref:DNA-binding transcriptional LysR family regulator n=1 Tax=Cupriavidus plantarum TaxID=942865 RepID=A0A316F9Z9_9BURK|nr:LysR substrate-binding domain-containing protein [Cupriavidus plantarum]PWK34064.1 DNA-binding transcriptional LysR family regulator [Cupriavidus plantarum]